MVKPMVKLASMLTMLMVLVAIAPLGVQNAQASEYFYFKSPSAGSSYTVGKSVPVSFYAGVVNKETRCDAWGNPSTTIYHTMKAQLKVFKGTTEIYSKDFTYERGTTLETKYVPNTTGKLTLRIYGQKMSLSDTSMVQYDSVNITVKAKKAAAVKKIKPKIAVDRVEKKAVEITCSNTMGFGMKIYRATKPNGTYKLIKKTKKDTFTDKKVSAKKVYYYKVKLWAKSGGKIYQSKWSKKQKAAKFIAKVVVTQKGSKCVKITWKKIKGAGYYLVCRNNKGVGSEYDVISCEDKSALTYYDKTVEQGKTYYYAIIGVVGDDGVAGKYFNNRFKVKVK